MRAVISCSPCSCLQLSVSQNEAKCIAKYAMVNLMVFTLRAKENRSFCGKDVLWRINISFASIIRKRSKIMAGYKIAVVDFMETSIPTALISDL